jgi:gamma-glutamyltranspeptidase/glutathione hydrolase
MDTMSQLASMGHEIVPASGWNRIIFGKGQIIHRNPKNSVLTAGSDPRADGCAIAW